MVSGRGAVSIVELIYYTPALGLAIWIATRHGLGRASGWYFLILLSLARIIGGSMELASDGHHNISLVIGAAILSNLGLSPLILAMLGILKRVNEGMPAVHAAPLRLFSIIHIPMTVGLILTIVGGSQSYSDGQFHAQTTSKVAIVLFAASYVCLSVAAVLQLRNLRHISSGERHLLFAVLASIPFLAVRLLYALLGTFQASYIFNSISDKVTIFATMAVLMEFIVVAFYLAAGITAPVIPRSTVQPAQKKESRFGRPENGATQSHPVHELSDTRQPLAEVEAPFVRHELDERQPLTEVEAPFVRHELDQQQRYAH